MTSMILWKEYREQRLVWLALLALAVLVLVGLPLLVGHDLNRDRSFTELMLLGAALLGWTYGMVSGAMLLAGEREAGTDTFVEGLPGPRLNLWIAKAGAGALLLLAYAVAVALLAQTNQQLPGWTVVPMLLLVLLGGAIGLGWGLLASSAAGSVLSAIGVAILGQIAYYFVGHAILYVLLLSVVWLLDLPDAAPAVLAGLILFNLLPLPLSAWVYARTDRLREDGVTPAEVQVTDRTGWRQWRSALWLVWRQGRALLFTLPLVCLLAGVLAISNMAGFYPLLSLGVGVLCGVSLLLDEQGGAYRFLGAGRFPLARLWLVKLLSRVGLAGLCLILLLLPACVADISQILVPQKNEPQLHQLAAHVFGTPLIGYTIPTGLLLLGPVIYGFVLGHLAGIYLRKAVVALVVAYGLGLLPLALWLPSMVAGGLHGWQVLAAPAVLLLATVTLLGAWVNERLNTGWPLLRLAAAGLLAIGLTAGALAYRVWEVPDVPEPQGFEAFVADLAEAAENEAGTRMRGALIRLGSRIQEGRAKPPGAMAPGMPPGAAAEGNSLLDQAATVGERGWPATKGPRPKLAVWLDDLFTDEDWQVLHDAAALPAGMIEDPRNMTLLTRLAAAREAPSLGTVLTARGLQKQAEGDPAVFVRHLDTGLAVVRNLANHAPEIVVPIALSTEDTLLHGVERWLERLDGRPDLLRQALTALTRHTREMPEPYREIALVAYLICRNGLDQPQTWLPYAGSMGPQAALVALIRQVPWERQRQERLVRLQFDRQYGGAGTAGAAYPWQFALLPALPVKGQRYAQGMPRRQVLLEATRLMVGLRLYQAEKTTPARRLSQLVPEVLPAVPADPFGGGPFRYRLSKGEEIVWPADAVLAEGASGGAAAGGMGMPGAAAAPAMGGPPGMPGMMPAPPEPKRKIPAGQGILWSVGEDRIDDRGHRQGAGDMSSLPGSDLIYLVPLPLRKP